MDQPDRDRAPSSPRPIAAGPPFRKYPRLHVNIPAQWGVDGQIASTRILTLGGGGLLLGITQELSPSTELEVRFRLTRRLAIVQAKARVRYQLPDAGTGVEYTVIEPRDRQKILRLILRRIGEKRQFPRKPFITQVEHEAGSFLGRSRDISVGGMFIETTETLAGSLLSLRFHWEDGGRVVTAQAQVLYVVKDLGVGVQFLKLDPADRKRIDLFVTGGDLS